MRNDKHKNSSTCSELFSQGSTTSQVKQQTHSPGVECSEPFLKVVCDHFKHTHTLTKKSHIKLLGTTATACDYAQEEQTEEQDNTKIYFFLKLLHCCHILQHLLIFPSAFALPLHLPFGLICT